MGLTTKECVDVLHAAQGDAGASNGVSSIVKDLLVVDRSRAEQRVRVTKDITSADPIPDEGVQAALEVMASGRLYRYNVESASDSLVSLVEVELAQYTGHKYCVALNSCGSALYLMLLAAGVQPGDKVLTNAFTFNAVPSAIHHAGAQPVYVETSEDLTIDLVDLRNKAQQSGAKYCLVSHMRGKVADMDEVKRICDDADVIMLEDCAHSLGVRFGDGTKDAPHVGLHGVACGFSSQSYKMLNSGEGGFYLTNDEVMAAKVAVYAGAYERLSQKHLAVPSKEVFSDLPNLLPNYSMRMSNLSAAILRPQIKTLEARVEVYNRRYTDLVGKLARHPNIRIPTTSRKVRSCGDSLQFTLVGDVSDKQVRSFMDVAKEHGLVVGLFGGADNARNFVNWKFCPGNEDLPATAKIISRTMDLRLPLTWDDADFDTLCTVILESLAAIL